jgi:hypothetical protein
MEDKFLAFLYLEVGSSSAFTAKNHINTLSILIRNIFIVRGEIKGEQ